MGAALNLCKKHWIRHLPVGCHVNVVFLSHEGHLIAVEPSESKHPNLLNDVAPISRRSCMLPIRLRNFVMDWYDQKPFLFEERQKKGKQHWIVTISELVQCKCNILTFHCVFLKDQQRHCYVIKDEAAWKCLVITWKLKNFYCRAVTKYRITKAPLAWFKMFNS
jgi:hypothetical protein